MDISYTQALSRITRATPEQLLQVVQSCKLECAVGEDGNCLVFAQEQGIVFILETFNLKEHLVQKFKKQIVESEGQ